MAYYDKISIGNVLVCISKSNESGLPFGLKVTVSKIIFTDHGFGKKQAYFVIRYFENVNGVYGDLKAVRLHMSKGSFVKNFILEEDYKIWERKNKINKIKKKIGTVLL